MVHVADRNGHLISVLYDFPVNNRATAFNASFKSCLFPDFLTAMNEIRPLIVINPSFHGD